MSFIVNFVKTHCFQVVFATCKVALVLGVFTEFAQGMEKDHCLYCNDNTPSDFRYANGYTRAHGSHWGDFNGSLMIFTFEELDNYIQEEGLPYSRTGVSYFEHVNDISKKQKISQVIQHNITQRSIPIDRKNLVETVLEYFFAKSNKQDKDKILRWESILREDPEAKKNIFQFICDYNDLNPERLMDSYGCLESHSVLLNSSGAYHIIDELETFHGDDWGTYLEDLPKSISSLSWLRSLYIKSYGMSGEGKISISSGFAKLVNLTELYLNDCIVEKLSEILSSLTALTKLNLEDLDIRELPNTIGKLINLVRLDISNNYIGSLPTSIANLTKLETFIWQCPEPLSLSFLPTAFGKFLTKREMQYNIKIYPGQPEDWIGDNKLKTRSGNCRSSAISGGFPVFLEDDTIYLKLIDANLPERCCYVVTGSQDKNEYFEDEFEILPLHRNSFSTLKDAVMKHLSDQGDVITNGIYCKTLFISDDANDYYEFIKVGYEPIRCVARKRFNTGYYPSKYRNMVLDCYHRYQDHHKKRCWVNEIARLTFLDDPCLDVPSDITCYIAGLIYYLEEKKLYDSFNGSFMNQSYNFMEAPD